MKTTAVYHGFALQHELLSKELVQRIVAVAPLQRLYLLGLTTAQQRTETLFSVSSATRYEVAHYFLLALAEKEDDLFLSRVQDKIEGHLHHWLPVTAIVFSTVQFSRWLVEGHPFAAAVYQKAFLLYEQDEMPLPLPATPDEEGLRKEAEQLFIQTRTRVQEFLAGAELYTVRVQYRMAAFMLHQAAEQALRTILILHTGLRLNTHSLDRLVRCCTMFCSKLPDVFPRGNEQEKRVFQLLQKAYIDTRYKEDYRIRLEELQLLTERVKKLQEIFLRSGAVICQPPAGSLTS